MITQEKLEALKIIQQTVLEFNQILYKQNTALSNCWPNSALNALKILFPKGIE